MAAHAKLSASKMKQAKACPGSVAAQKGFPNRESKAAREGTAAHWMAEEVLLDAVRNKRPLRADARCGCNEHLANIVGLTAPNGVKLTKAMANAVQVYIDEVMARADGAEVVHIEVKLSGLAALDPDLGGNSDAIILHRGRRTLYVMDYKNGAGVIVDPTENEQALTYGLGAILHPGISLADIDHVEIVIVQPNAPGEAVKVWRTDAMRLIEWSFEIVSIADATRAPGAPRVAGEHCQFCLAKGECNAHYNFALDAAGLTAVDFFSEVIPKLEPATRLSPAELSTRLRQAEHLKRWIKGVEEHALQMAADGTPPDGFKLVAGRGSRTFNDASGAFAHLAGELGFSTADFYEREPMSVAGVETFVGKKTLKKLEAPEWKDLWKSEPGRPQLAPDTDPRPAIEKKNGFDDVSDFDAD